MFSFLIVIDGNIVPKDMVAFVSSALLNWSVSCTMLAVSLREATASGMNFFTPFFSVISQRIKPLIQCSLISAYMFVFVTVMSFGLSRNDIVMS